MGTKIKRKITGMISCMIIATMFLGCGNKKETKNISIDVEALAKQIVAEGSFSDELSRLDDDMFDSQYPDIDMDLINKACAYVGTGATAEQVVIVEVKDGDSITSIKEGLQKKLDEDIVQNQDYLPEEVPKLQKPVLTETGNYVILAVSNDNSKVLEIIEKESE